MERGDDLLDGRAEPPPFDDARPAGEIVGDDHILVAERLQQLPRVVRARIGDLEHEMPARTQPAQRGSRDHLGRPRPDERVARLPLAHLRVQRGYLGRIYIRRVGDDHVPLALADPRGVALEQLDIQAQGSGILARDVDRAGRAVDARHARSRMLGGDRQRDRARSDADVDDGRDAVEQRQAAVDDDLRLGARHQHAPVDLQRQPTEPPLAEHVGERLAGLAAGDERPIPLHRADLVDERQAGTRRPEHVRKQELRVDARRGDAGRLQPRRALAERVAGGHTPAVSSARRRSSSASASVNSSSSPPSTLSSACTVTCTRWSVTRFSGKL